MTYPSKTIFFVAGENSGDQRTADVVRHIKALEPEWELVGLGGPQMEEAGMRLLRDMIHDMAIVGLVEVFTKAHKILQIYRMAKRYLVEHRPDAVVLVDYPGFNLGLLAPQAKRLGIPVIYYIVPQVWAWHRGRIRKFKKYCDKIIPILPFEEALLRREGIDADYLGHSLIDTIRLSLTREQVFERFGFDPSKKLVGMLPGSRKHEVRALLPIMLDAAERLGASLNGNVQFVLCRAKTTPLDLIESYLRQTDINVAIVDEGDPYSYDVRAALDFSWVKSGTSTLEAALLGVPFVIIYKVNYITAWIARRVLNIPFLGLPNIIADDLVVPELLQEQATGENLADQAQHYLRNPRAYGQMQYQLRKIRDTLGPPGSSKRTAEAIVGFLKGKSGS